MKVLAVRAWLQLIPLTEQVTTAWDWLGILYQDGVLGNDRKSPSMLPIGCSDLPGSRLRLMALLLNTMVTYPALVG